MLPSRFARAATVGPCDSRYEYVSAMPFTYSAQLAHERYVDTRNRLSSVERSTYTPPPVRTYRNAYTATSSTSYDYKVMDYANRLDQEEATREYIDSSRRSRYDSYMSSRAQREASPFRQNYDYYSPQKYDRNYHVDTSDVGYSWKHYRLSNQTLSARNARAKSPIQSRELDRYYKTERRASFIGDVSSGTNRDFRYYSYRPVPYFGGSDHYQMDVFPSLGSKQFKFDSTLLKIYLDLLSQRIERWDEFYIKPIYKPPYLPRNPWHLVL